MILTNTILLIEPVGFGFNSQTAADNRFQKNNSSQNIIVQFENFKKTLENAGINVIVFKPHDIHTPDAVYPNNWFSTFPDNKMIIYPMMAINRRLERRVEFIENLKKKYSNLIDLTELETTDNFIEGTGSLVIDHDLKIAYACLSKRTTLFGIEKWESVTGYKVIKFTANDENGFPVYHTNVILTLSPAFAIVCLDSILPSDKIRITESLSSSGREIISISFEQTKMFCGNCLVLKNKREEQLLIMSDQAKGSFTKDQLTSIEKYVKIVSSDLSEIESIGGGGARCMVAELF